MGGNTPVFSPLIYGQRGHLLHGEDARKGQADVGKEGIEETDTQEKTTKANTIIDLSDVPGEKQDTPRKESQENDEEGDYIPTPQEDREQSELHSGRERGGGDEMRSITSEQTERTKDNTIRSRSEGRMANQKNNKKSRKTRDGEQSRRKRGGPKKKKKSRSEYTPIRRSSHEPIKNQQRMSITEK